MAWYVRHGGQTLGPWEESEVVSWIHRAGTAATEARQLETNQWVYLPEYPPFAKALRDAAAGTPPLSIAPAKRKGFDPDNLTGPQIAALLAMALGVLVAWSKCESSKTATPQVPSQPAAPPEQDPKMAWGVAEAMVRNTLKSPDSAKFSHPFSGEIQSSEDHIRHLGGGHFLATGWVDSQNSFGATLRGDFVVKLHCLKAYECQLDEPIQLVTRQ